MELNVLQVEEQNETCTVCVEEFKSEEEIAILRCNHIFHEICLRQWVTTKMSHLC